MGTWLSQTSWEEEFARHPPTQAENFEVLTESCPWGPDKKVSQHSDFHPVQTLGLAKTRCRFHGLFQEVPLVGKAASLF